MDMMDMDRVYRQREARQLGLPETATWADIDDVYRKRQAKNLGLPEIATWYEQYQCIRTRAGVLRTDTGAKEQPNEK